MFKRCLPVLVASLLVSGLALAADAPREDTIKPQVTEGNLSGYKLVWHDEFDGDKLNTADWDYRTDSKMWSTQKLENVAISGGLLHLNVKKEEAGKMHYTGSGIITKKEFKYGYYESRFKVPPGAGWHTSFWMQKHDGSGGTGPTAAAQELDVCENDSVKLTSYGVNVHQWNPKPHKAMGGKGVKTPDLSADFHVWGCEFTPQKVTFFFDGKIVQTVDATKFAHGPQNIWLTTIATSLGGAKKVDDSKLPAAAEYDYVRYFAKE